MIQIPAVTEEEAVEQEAVEQQAVEQQAAREQAVEGHLGLAGLRPTLCSCFLGSFSSF